jgi:hypothetical protein
MKPNLFHSFQRSLRSLAVILPAGFFAGCAGTGALRSSFNDYSGVYAETQNQQMLLNLARLHEGYPIYFFQLGQISASYTFTETAGLAGTTSKTVSAVNPPSVLSGTANLGETITHNPIFTLVPLAGNMFAKQLLQPISPTIFEQNFEQGWPVDQLMRILVERIEITEVVTQKVGNTTSNTTIMHIFENNPRDGEGGDPNFQFDPKLGGGEPTGYDHFLRACALARACQKAGVLRLVRNVEFVPLQSLIEPADEPKAPPPGGNPAAADPIPVTVSSNSTPTTSNSTIVIVLKDSAAAAKDPAAGPGGSGATKDSLLTDVTNADKDDLAYQKTPKTENPKKDAVWKIGKNVESASFQFDKPDGEDSKIATLLVHILNDPATKDIYVKPPSDIPLFLGVIYSGFSISDKTSANPDDPVSASPSGPSTIPILDDKGEPTKVKHVTQVRFVMRSLMGVITDLATEQDAFDARNRETDPLFQHIPPEESHALLKLTWLDNNYPSPTIASLDLNNKHFAIADDLTTDPQLPKTWNRDVFRMLVQLSFEVTTDATSLPATSTVSVRGN